MPAGTAVTYRSDRPSVVVVDGHGTLQAVAAGDVTVTTTATYQGGTVSTSFVMTVPP